MSVSLAQVQERLHIVTLPLHTRFRGVTEREVALIEGDAGFGEWSPFIEYAADEAAVWLEAALDDAWTERPVPLRERVRVNATVPAVPAASVPELLARFPGTRTAKVKVAERGQSLRDDLTRVAAVRDALGDEGRIRVDANGGWSLDEAELALRALAGFGLEYAEQPVGTVPELAELRARLAGLVPVAADESVRKASDPLAVVRAGAADIVVVKAQPLGGLRRALATAGSAGVPVVVSSALDSSVGLGLGAALAGALPALPYDCGLGTASLLAADVTHAPIAVEHGSVPVRRAIPDPGLLQSLRAPAERERWWRDRLTASWPHVAPGGAWSPHAP